jgi:membrane associated rhomboid family serine protease
MRDAAVGFQCPACVAEGTKATRQGRTAYGGRRSGNPATTSLVLIGLNVAVWLAITLTGGRASALADRLALLVGGRCDPVGQAGTYTGAPSEQLCQEGLGGTWVDGVTDGAVWQLVTSMFTHVEVWHLAGNMIVLYLLGPQLEAAVGRMRFLALYLVSGLAGSAMVLWFTGPQVQTVGASGAIFGLMGALLVMVVKVGGNVSQIGLLLLANVVITVTIPGISWQGHLGGFLGGALVGAVLVYAPRGPRRPVWQATGVGLVTLAVLAAIGAGLAAA